MNENVKLFVEFEDERKPHRQVLFAFIGLMAIFLGLLYFASYNIRWLFYLTCLISGFLLLWGLPLLFIDTYIKRKTYYIYLSVSRFHMAFLLINTAYAALTTAFDIGTWLYFSICAIVAILSIMLYFLNKKQIENGVKLKSRKKIYIGLIAFSCVLGRIVAKTFLANMGKVVSLGLVFFGFSCVAISFLNLGVKDFLKYYYIKQLEYKNEVS